MQLYIITIYYLRRLSTKDISSTASPQMSHAQRSPELSAFQASWASLVDRKKPQLLGAPRSAGGEAVDRRDGDRQCLTSNNTLTT